MAYRDTKNVRIDFLDVIENTWVWNKLTENEKRIFKNILCAEVKDKKIEDKIKYAKEWDKLHHLYNDLLDLVGYRNFGWREEKEVKEITVKLSIDSEGNVKVTQ